MLMCHKKNGNCEINKDMTVDYSLTRSAKKFCRDRIYDY